ncbi:hypothetical protein RW1_085_00040 [Rhodococcus wratislaviensis NBRC 100605]|uniref:Transposase InsH N-terminal domain-containing protein n=1 Tax=Rhodococcus wratislaviensis NBRC 100605 TaxID=1219028 RepID=X0QF21_RHOWR|nr:hypothetical protein RW1_085_00040 [Rhodococcus wratislaviensis NBRC 100605]
MAGHLLPEGSVYSFLAEHRYELFPPELFTDLFPSTRGRPSLAPEVVASVLVLHALHGLSDRAAAEAVTFDLRWKAACGLPVDGAAFHPTVLAYWRKRLAASERSEERSNSRNGYRHRDFDTRAGTLDVAIPKLRYGSYFPDSENDGCELVVRV